MSMKCQAWVNEDGKPKGDENKFTFTLVPSVVLSEWRNCNVN